MPNNKFENKIQVEIKESAYKAKWNGYKLFGEKIQNMTFLAFKDI